MPTAEEVRAAHQRRMAGESAPVPSGEGPSAAEVVAAHRRRKAAPEPVERSGLARFGASVAEPVLRTGIGFRKTVLPLFPESIQESEAPVTESWERDLATLQEIAGEGALPTAGRIGGEILTFAGPGGVGAQAGRRALPQALRWRRAPTVGAATGEVAAIGALEAGRTVGTPEERAEAAATAAGGALAGYGVGAALQKGVQGIRRSPQGEELVQYGATPGQVAEGRLVPWTEENLRRVPGWGGINRLQEKAIEQWDDAILKSVWPGARGIGFEAIDGIQKQIGKAYDDVWAQGAKLTKFTPEGLGDNVPKVLDPLVSRFDDATAKNLKGFLSRQITSLARSESGEGWQRFNTQMRDYASDLRKKGDFPQAEVVEEIRDEILGFLPTEVSSRLKELNRAYRDLQVVQRAVRYQPAAEAGGVFSPVDLLKAARAEGSKRLFAAGRAAMQQPARAAQGLSPSVETRRMGLGAQWGPGASAGLVGYAAGGPVGALTAYGAGIPMATEPVRRLLLGETRLQGERTRELVRQLRKAQAPAGAAVVTELER